MVYYTVLQKGHDPQVLITGVVDSLSIQPDLTGGPRI